MKKLKNSIVIENVKIGLHSLNKRDTTFNSEGTYYCSPLLEKKSEQLQSVMDYIAGILTKEQLDIKKEMAKPKSPIGKHNDGDTIAKKYEDEKNMNDRGEYKGQHLKNMYSIKISTSKDFLVFDMNKKGLDKTKINWNGAMCNIHCSPYIFNNKFGKGLKIILLNIQVIEEGKGFDTAEEAFGEIKKGDELPF